MEARDALARAHVARAKAINQDVPPDMKKFEDEYDSNKNDSFKGIVGFGIPIL